MVFKGFTTKENTMNVTFIKSAFAGLVLSVSGFSNAGLITDFTDGYEVSNWTYTLRGGAIDVSRGPSTITMISSNNGSGFDSNTDFTIEALSSGLVSFSWSYTTVDAPFYDPFGWLLNGKFTKLSINIGGSQQAGTTSFLVNSGDIFGFRANTYDSRDGSAATTISTFSAPTSVPEPSTLVIFALGLIGLASRRFKKQ